MKTKKLLGIILVFSIILSAILVPSSFSAGAQVTAQDMQAFLDEQMEEIDFKGVALVTKNGKVNVKGARGMADTTEGKEMTMDTLFPIGSNSKLFCSVAVLMLRDQGKLSVDDTLSKYFPEYELGKDVTIKNLLTMRSGIQDHYEIGLLRGEYTLTAEGTPEENEQIILDWIYSKKLLFKAGYNYKYSNTNYFLLSLIVEQVSGMEYKTFLEKNIFTPLSMEDTFFYEDVINHPDLAEHTLELEEGELIAPEHKSLLRGAGDLVSSVSDMNKWMTALRENTLLSKETTKEICTSYTLQSGFGYGIGVASDGGLNYLGGIDCYLSALFTHPEEGINVFIVSNDYNIDSDVFTNFAVELYYMARECEMPAGICGDANCDEKVNVRDVTEIQKHIAGIIKLSDEGYDLSDVDASGTVNIKDATAIQKHIAGMNTGYPIGK